MIHVIIIHHEVDPYFQDDARKPKKNNNSERKSGQRRKKMSGKSSEIEGLNWVIECNHVETPNSSSVLNFKPQLVINQENATLSCLHRMDSVHVAGCVGILIV